MLIASPALGETIRIEIPDNIKNAYFNTFASITGWTSTIPDPNDPELTIPNPISKKQNFINVLKGLIEREKVAYDIRVYQKNEIEAAKARISAEKERIERDERLPDQSEIAVPQ